MKARFLTAIVCLALLCSAADAARRPRKAAPAAPPKPPAPPTESYICIETSTGYILAEQNADVVRPPASMVKMMLMLMVSEGLEQGLWTLDETLTISKRTELVNESQVDLREGEQFTVGQLMNAVAVCSANDAAAAVAEGLWGSVENYVAAINKRARELGMADSEFISPHGLPPGGGLTPDQTTARDMAILAQHCVLHPSIMQWVGQQDLVFRVANGTRHNTNKLLWTVPGCDGMKTGYTRAAGWCLTATAQRDEVRLIVVVMGYADKNVRFATAQRLLEEGFNSVSRELVVAKGQKMDSAVQVANCSTPTVQLAAASDIWVVVPKQNLTQVQVVPQQPELIQAPAQAGTVVGEVQVKLGDRVLAKGPLALTDNLDAASWRWKMQQTVKRTGLMLRRSKQVEQGG